MTTLDIPHLRLLNQRISLPTFSKPDDVVAWLGAVQAQDYAGAKWALGVRMQGATDHDIDAAFSRGDILRTHVLRPTWHFVTPADIRWMLTLTAPRVHAANAHMYRRVELDSDVFERSERVLEDALRGGRHLTRDELRDVLASAGIATDGTFRMSYLMMHAELEGIVCSGPRRGKQFTYALLDERAPDAKCLGRDEALAELARRYFASRGPARLEDFVKWSGLTVADGRLGLEAVKGDLQCEVVGASEYWLAPAAPAPAATEPVAHLLSVYDEYVSGYRGWSTIVDDETSKRLVAMDNALTSIVIVDGRIVGTWKRTLRKNDVVVETRPLVPLTEAEKRAVAAAVKAYGGFLGKRVVTA